MTLVVVADLNSDPTKRFTFEVEVLCKLYTPLNKICMWCDANHTLEFTQKMKCTDPSDGSQRF